MPEVSVVIPAHNEEQMIGKCLRSLLEGLDPQRAEIIVVCNGCTDTTASMAREFGAMVQVDELPAASKAAALNRGDELATVFPRVYLDADVQLSGPDLVTLAGALRGSCPPLAGAPQVRVEAGGRPWGVRAYYRVWTRTPYVTDDMIGSGVYALSEAGRARFDRFPSIIADDFFVYRHFKAGERVRVAEATFTVRPPATLRELIHVNGRRRAGIVEWTRAFPSANGDTASPRRGPALQHLARDPRWWPSLAVYASVVGLSTAKGRWKARFGDLKVWERQERER